MKLLMLGWELPPHNSGGLGVACYQMAKALARRDIEIDFILPYHAYHPKTEFMKIHAATRLDPLDRYGLMGAYDSRYVKQADLDAISHNDLSTIRGVQKQYIRFVEKFVEHHQPEAIHAHDWLTMEAGVRAKELTGAPLIVHVHATEFDRSGQKQGNPIVHEIEYQGLMMADRVIAVSGITKQIIVDNYGIPADKIEVVHNAFDVDDMEQYTYDHKTYRYVEQLKADGYSVAVTITRFTVQKGLTHMMKAAAQALERYDRLIFLFVGDGEQRDELIQMAAEYGISDKVFFTGFVRGKQWRDAYSVADMFIMSSVSEPFGLTALEAAHHDTALLISKQSGVGEVLNSIFRFDFWDTDKLADQIVGVAASPALQQSLAQDVKQEYLKFSWQDVAIRCQELYSNTSTISRGLVRL